MTEPRATLRLDRWLWQARLCKTRTLAADRIARGKVRVNGQKVVKPGRAVGPGDLLTLALPSGIRVLRIVALPARRGPPAEARACYEEVDGPATA